MAEIEQKVKGIIDSNAVVVFSKSYCPYCANTKHTLNKLGVKFFLLELDKIDDGGAIQDALEGLTGQRSVPNIFIKKQHIGGNSELQSLKSAGKLEGLLRQAGAL